MNTEEQTPQSTGFAASNAMRWLRWMPRSALVGVALSIIAHLVFAIFATQLRLQQPAQAGGAGLWGDIVVELAVATEVELSELDDQPLPEQQIELQLEALPEPTAISVAIESTAVAFDEDALAAVLAMSGAGADSNGERSGADAAGGLEFGGGAGDGAASFFGVEAVGSRFAYLVDVSHSMEGDKLDALKRELRKSIMALPSRASFTVVTFSTDAASLDGNNRWRRASESNRLAAMQLIARLVARGGTEPKPAFELAFGLQPRPDAIYFMTDGRFDPRVPGSVSRLNGRGDAKTPVHCISFASRDAEPELRRIAGSSGGTYTHIAGPTP